MCAELDKLRIILCVGHVETILNKQYEILFQIDEPVADKFKRLNFQEALIGNGTSPGKIFSLAASLNTAKAYVNTFHPPLFPCLSISDIFVAMAWHYAIKQRSNWGREQYNEFMQRLIPGLVGYYDETTLAERIKPAFEGFMPTSELPEDRYDVRCSITHSDSRRADDDKTTPSDLSAQAIAELPDTNEAGIGSGRTTGSSEVSKDDGEVFLQQSASSSVLFRSCGCYGFFGGASIGLVASVLFGALCAGLAIWLTAPVSVPLTLLACVISAVVPGTAAGAIEGGVLGLIADRVTQTSLAT